MIKEPMKKYLETVSGYSKEDILSKLKRKFKHQMDAAGSSQLNVLGLVACEAAYEHGEEWYQAMKTYVKENETVSEK